MGPAKRETVDLSNFSDLVVIYLGMRVRTLSGIKTPLGFGPRISPSVEARPDGESASDHLRWRAGLVARVDLGAPRCRAPRTRNARERISGAEVVQMRKEPVPIPSLRIVGQVLGEEFELRQRFLRARVV